MYKLDNLNYTFEALEPYIDAKTVEIHYGKHHQNYLNKTNTLLEANSYDMRYPLEEVLTHLELFKESDHEALLFNIGGVLNHNLYFKTLSPNKNTIPSGKLTLAINEEFGSFDAFKEKVTAMANSFMGSGWIFLVINSNKKLELIKAKNQETPYANKLIPIMALDLWEHAYYLKYQNLRTDYINNFFNIIDFKIVNAIYEENN